MSIFVVGEVIVRAHTLFGHLRTCTAPLKLRIFSFEMELRSIQTSGGPPSAFEHHGALCRTLLLRSNYTARALSGAVVPDPSGAVAPCLPLHILEGLYALHLTLGDLAERRAFDRFSISPTALARAEEAGVVAAGLGLSPATLEVFSARVCAPLLRYSLSLLVGAADIAANETSGTKPPSKQAALRTRRCFF